MSAPADFGSLSAVAMRSSRLIELDVEGLAHVSAAVAQKLHYLRPVLYRVEMRFHRLRLRRYLAQRQRSRENLYKQGFHWFNDAGGRITENTLRHLGNDFLTNDRAFSMRASARPTSQGVAEICISWPA